MIKRIQLIAAAALVALVVSAALLAGGSAAKGQTAAPGQKAAEVATAERGLTAQERRGKAIYLRGESPSGKEITAVVGEIDVPASTVTCAGCHGFRAEGKTEGGVTAGNLTWATLIKPYGHTHPSGRKHGPFNESLFARALIQGIDPDGNELVVAMPRYRMSAKDAADLIAYLKRIETERDPGLGETSIKVGAIIPTKGALADSGAAMRDVLAAYFEEVNSRGGIYNRKIELTTAETGDSAAATAANARKFAVDGQLFAMVGGLSAGADKELAALTQESEIPYVGPSTLLPQVGFQTNRYIFYLLPGMGEQGRALVNFAAGRQPLASARVRIVAPESEIATTAAAAVEAQCKKAGCADVQKTTYAAGRFDAASLARSLKGADVVFFLGSNGEDVSFLKEAAAAGWTPSVFLLGTLAARDIQSSVPAVFKDKLFLAYPTLPSDITPAGRAEFRALLEKYKFPVRHAAAQLSAMAAAKVLVEGLQRAGKDLSREKLITALEGLYDYDTGVTPRLTYGPNRRVGASGAYILGIDPEKQQFIPVSDWVKAN